MSASAGQEQVGLSVAEVSQRYGQVEVLHDVSLSVTRGEFVTLLGPSGSGKTTLLRVMAGFVRPTQGRVCLWDEDVTDDPPHKRSTNMVFQRPTLFPHLDVFQNVAFGLRLAGLDKAETKARVEEMLALVQLQALGRRRASQLSGGQMQRVALARALVLRPKVLLLDEPFSALDLRIRLDLEVELRRLHRELGATFVYVTHDQREALALSDRIAVLDRGRIEQVGSAVDIYRRPASEFAARFVGSANLLPAEVVATGGGRAEVQVAGCKFGLDGLDEVGKTAWVVLRPEAVTLTAEGGQLRGTVLDVAFRGGGYTYKVVIPELDDHVTAEVPANGGAPFAIGTEVGVDWSEAACSLLPR